MSSYNNVIYHWKGVNIHQLMTGELELQLPVQSEPITTDVVSVNSVHGEIYLIQHYVIKFVDNL